MRSHCALYVDVGYLLAAAATRAAGTSLRSSIRVDHKRLIESLIAHVTEASGLPLLRVHWYDAARNGVPDETQEKIGLLPRVKVRLGRIGVDGEQKGVDLRIGLDLVAHARNEAVDVVFLVSGDDDLTEAVEEAQAHGVQVTVLAVPNKKGDPQSVSRYLQRAADGLELITAGALDAAVRSRTTGILDAPPPPEVLVLDGTCLLRRCWPVVRAAPKLPLVRLPSRRAARLCSRPRSRLVSRSVRRRGVPMRVWCTPVGPVAAR